MEKVIIEMIQNLLEMSTNTYMKSKYMLLSVCDHPKTKLFLEKLFELVDEKRPLAIEMKEGTME